MRGVFAAVFDPLASGVQRLAQGDICHRQIQGRQGAHDVALRVHFGETCGRRAAPAGFFPLLFIVIQQCYKFQACHASHIIDPFCMIKEWGD